MVFKKITFWAQVNAETGFFKLSQEKPSKYKSGTSFYKGRGLIQLTGNLNKDKTAYDDPGPYEDYGKYLADNGYLEKGKEGIFITNPDLISKDLHYAIDSAGWEWSIEKKALSYIRDYGDKEKNAYAKWKRDTFPKGVGKSLNDIALAYEETIEEEKYFWFQSKILNGYPLTHKDKPDPHGWDKRKEGLRKLKAWFKYDKAVCRGEKELKLDTGNRAPWINIAWEEYNKYKGLIEKQSPLKEKISIYFKESNSKLNYNDPWCAAFVTWCFKQTEYLNIIPEGCTYAFAYTELNSPKAKLRGVKGWLQGEISEPFIGAVIVFNYSHVAFIVGENNDGSKYVYLGGNQGDKRQNHQKICLGSVSKKDSSIYAIMKPKKYIISDDEKKLPKYDVNIENSGNSSR
ncbi:hypothetical protein GYM73_06010 [Apibacter sp. ESL0432]|uniref:CHAP domain-containing protein n=1 Tax=Apibacter sp. ESL0432 TaxID=2704652 RepID=UPI001C69C5A8|nr:CHAP domain-containing protein [Apibacter sp. ESL0432]QYN49179.1 hypothetical protein GYM73_06010 [Apibacter sp. ESL0432]